MQFNLVGGWRDRRDNLMKLLSHNAPKLVTISVIQEDAHNGQVLIAYSPEYRAILRVACIHECDGVLIDDCLNRSDRIDSFYFFQLAAATLLLRELSTPRPERFISPRTRFRPDSEDAIVVCGELGCTVPRVWQPQYSFVDQ